MHETPIPYEILVLVCTNIRDDGRDACGRRDAADLRDLLREEVAARGLRTRVRVSQTGCLGKCGAGPNIVVVPDGIWYSGVTREDLPIIVARHFGG